MVAIIEKSKISEDESLLGTMHMISHHALILRHRARYESTLAQIASKIHELAYSGMAMVDDHPNSVNIHHERDTLANKLRKIEELINELKTDEQTFHEIKQIRNFLTKAYTLAVGHPSATACVADTN